MARGRASGGHGGHGGWWTEAPWWAWVVIVAGVVLLAVGVPAAMSREAPPATDVDGSAAATLTDTAADVPTIAFIGDSYTAGTSQFGGVGPAGYPAIVAGRLGMKPVIAAEGGTGYLGDVNNKHVTYPDQVDAVVRADPDIVVILGSRNDQGEVPQAVGDAALRMYQGLRQRLPDARLLVVGPVWPVGVPPTNLQAVNGALASAAKTAGLPYVDALEADWLQGLPPGSIGNDNSHPTDAGHQALADLVESALRGNRLV